MPNQSVYLLQKDAHSPFLKRYAQLIEMCKEQGDFLSFDSSQDWLSCYSGDSQALYHKLPLIVFRPNSTSQIAPFIQLCAQLEIPVTVRSGGTGLSGGSIASSEGVLILTGHLKKIIDYNKEEGILSLEPGVTPRQLNHFVEKDGWYLPLSFATDAVAAIAGCLCTNARGYHQQMQSIYDAFKSVIIVDGVGRVIEVPGSLVCGSEGLLGIVIEVQISLKKIPERSLCFSFQGSFEDIVVHLQVLPAIEALKGIVFFNDCFYLKLEGESWRMPSAVALLEKYLPKLIPSPLSIEEISHSFYSTKRHFVWFTTHFRSNQLLRMSKRAKQLALEFELDVMMMSDVMAGSLHLILQSDDECQKFSEKIQSYLVLWTDFVDREHGVIAGTHGVGMLFRHFMTPFWTEESLNVFKSLGKTFDPHTLFGKERFFPQMGKSLEKVSSHD